VEGGVEALLPLEERLEDIAAASVLTELGPVVQVALVCLHTFICILIFGAQSTYIDRVQSSVWPLPN
jgi:hypothetical protein